MDSVAAAAVGGEEEVANKHSAKHQIFSFLLRRSRSHQITPDQQSSPKEEEPPVTAVAATTADLFRCPGNSASRNQLVDSDEVVGNGQAKTVSVKKSLFQPRGPFSLCCSSDGQAMTPVIVRYNRNNCSTTSSGKPKHRPSHSNYKDNLAYESGEIERRFYSPPPPPPVAEATERPRSRTIQVEPLCEGEEAVDTLNELKSCSNYSPSTFDRRPMYAEYYKQNTYNSIAMSACRSRLREKLLPPAERMNQPPGSGPQPEILSLPSDPEEGPSQTVSNAIINNNINSISVASPANGSPASVDTTASHNRNANTSQRPASTDSLARQALMAAQVLHLIPAERARARSVAPGQGAVCNNALLGASELNKILPNREVKIFVGTWNMNGEPPPMYVNFTP